MAYGLDIDELYCADADFNDIGVLNTYEIKLDIAEEKEFSAYSPEPIIPIGGIWYVPDTEYGGIVDGYETDSDEKIVTYKGRSWRGVMASHYIDFRNSKERIFTSGAGQEQFELEGDPMPTITDVINGLLVETMVDSVFVCDVPDTHETVDDELVECVVRRTDKTEPTLYDVIMQIVESNNFSLVFNYSPVDKKVHLVPILKQDYSDYLQYSNIASLGFQIEVDAMVVNHCICIAENTDTGEVRTIHFFTDEFGNMQPYTLVDNPTKDEHYILDKRNQVLFGAKEVAEVISTDDAEEESYEAVPVAPDDWTEKFGTYYRVVEQETEETEEVETAYELYIAIEEDAWELLTKKPSDWETNYSNYYTRTWNPDTQKYEGSAVSSVTTYGEYTRITAGKEPSDWKTNYSDYFYKFMTGVTPTSFEFRPYEGVPKERYVKLSAKPSDWNSNFSSYYRLVYEKVTYVKQKGKRKKKKVVKLVDCINRRDAKPVACRPDDDKKGGKIPSFYKRPHYMQERYNVAPKYNPQNCYRVKTIESAPPFNDPYDPKQYFIKKIVAVPPTHNPENCYRKVLDHYAHLADSARETFEEAQATNVQKMFIDDFGVNIGDVVGGKDEFTGTTVIGEVSNINVSLENGLIDADYEVKIMVKPEVEEESGEENEDYNR